MSEQAPFLDQALRVPRPTGRERKYRYQTVVTVERDQVRWDVADAYRWNHRVGDIGSTVADTHRTELETRVRLAYLATAEGTVSGWERSRTQIVAEFLRREEALVQCGRLNSALERAQSRNNTSRDNTSPGVAREASRKRLDE